MISSRTVMRFCVRVPVLSTHSTVAEPSVSTPGIRRVSTCLRDIRQAPSARNTVSTTGNSSGSIAIAGVMPASSPSSQLPRVKPVDHNHDDRGGNPENGQDPYQTVDFTLKRGALRLDAPQRRADLAELGIPRPCP